MSKTATFNKISFSYENKIIEEIDENEYVEVFDGIVVLESKNPKFKKGDVIPQISVKISIRFENIDGTEY